MHFKFFKSTPKLLKLSANSQETFTLLSLNLRHWDVITDKAEGRILSKRWQVTVCPQRPADRVGKTIFVGMKGRMEKKMKKSSKSECPADHRPQRKGISGMMGARLLSAWKVRRWVLFFLRSLGAVFLQVGSGTTYVRILVKIAYCLPSPRTIQSEFPGQDPRVCILISRATIVS